MAEQSTSTQFEPIPQPPGKFILGNLPDVMGDTPILDLMELAREYGPIYQLTFPEIPSLDEPIDFLVFFSHIKPNHIDLTQSFDSFDHGVIAASFGVEQQVFASLPKRGDMFMSAKKKFAF